MVDTTLRWEDELGRWLEPFRDRLGHKAGGGCVHYIFRDGLDRVIAGASS